MQNPWDCKWTVICNLLCVHVYSLCIIPTPRAKSETVWSILAVLSHQFIWICFSVLENARNRWKVFSWNWGVFYISNWTEFEVRTVDTPFWQCVVLEESEWDVNQHLSLLADCVFQILPTKGPSSYKSLCDYFLQCFNLNDEPRKIYKLIITAFNDQFLYIISTRADSDYVKLAIYNLDDMNHCCLLNIILSFINFHLHIKCKLHSFNGSSTICFKQRPKGRFYMAVM